ncbi:MAG: PEP-CTERM sorting domain-containing protein [Akkermansiaceae bacterium]|nr:PEP-CTERM sorting domain-containing protein [Akkermansiaceae bacterium]
MIVLLGLTSSGFAASISVNFSPDASVDNQAVDSGETSIVGITGTEAIDGSKWNNIKLRASGAGAPDVFITTTQGGNHIDLIDSSGGDAGVDLTSSGTLNSNYANVSSPKQGLTGDAGLMQGYLALNDTETISLTGLSAWAPNGYKVYAAFDIGGNETHGISMGDGVTSALYWTANSSATDSDPDNDGVMTWKQTTATTSGTAVTDANWAVYGTFTGDTLTISGTDNGSRSALSGFQVVALPVPEPSSAALLGLGCLALVIRRRK